MKEVDIGKISNEEWLALEKTIRVQALQCFMNGIVDQGGGESALHTMHPYVRMSGQAFTVNMTKLFDIHGDSLERIGQLCVIFEKLYGYDMIGLETGPNKFVRIGGTKCEWRDNPKEGCVIGHEMFVCAICEAVSPRL